MQSSKPDPPMSNPGFVHSGLPHIVLSISETIKLIELNFFCILNSITALTEPYRKQFIFKFKEH